MPLAQERLQACSARLSADGRKIVLGPGPAAWTEFCQSLPHARWSRFDCHWTCEFTPAAAWRIAARGDASIDAAITAAAARFGLALDHAHTRFVAAKPRLKTPPWTHQTDAYAFAFSLDATMLALEMGTGKSKTAIDLIVNWDCRKILILCPLSVRGVWQREIDRHAAQPIAVCIPSKGTVKDKTKIATDALRLAEARQQPIALVMNYDSAKMEPFAAWSLTQDWDAVICDESHRAKSYSSQTSKYVAKLGRKAKRRLCLTGTPLAQSPLDLFGQFRFLDPGLFGTSWHHFSNRYAIKGNPYVPQQITGYRNQEELQERFHLISYRCKAADVLDLPDKLHEERVCELGPKARKAYNDLENNLITEIGSDVATAANCLVRLLRLQQITSGFLLEDETKKPHILGTEKLDILSDLFDDLQGEPVVIFCRFRHDLAVVRNLVGLKSLRYGELSGESKDGLTSAGEMSPEIDVLGAQIQSGGLGVDLTRARIAIYLSLGFSLSDYEQTLARLHRPGQRRNVVYYHLIAEDTVDRRVYAALRARKDVIAAVLEGYLLKGGCDVDATG